MAKKTIKPGVYKVNTSSDEEVIFEEIKTSPSYQKGEVDIPDIPEEISPFFG